MATRTTLEEFQKSFEVKNGQVGSQDVLNKAPDKIKKELNDLWNWAAGEDTTELEGSVYTNLIDDDVNNVTSNDKVRSINWTSINLLSELINDETSSIKSWSCAGTVAYINQAAIDGGNW